MQTRVVATTILAAVLATTAVQSEDEGHASCASPEARQFDFWTGSWTVTANDKVAGHNRITSIHNGCTLLEEYASARSGYEGKSFNYFDPADGQWHQVWVDNSGLRLHLTGGYADRKMTMTGERAVDGKKVRDRITWHNNADGTVRQVWEVSKDDSTWSAVFDGTYMRREE